MPMRSGLCAVAMLMVAVPVVGQVVTPPELSLDSLLSVRVEAAARYDQTAAEAPASVTVITSEDIERFGWRTLAELLGSVQGFYVSDDRNYTYVGVRGFSRPTDYNNRVLLLLDGHPLNEGYYGLMPAGSDLGVDLRTVDRVEVIRGPASALYGSNAMFAVVQIVTREPGPGAGSAVRVSGGDRGVRAADVELAGRAGAVDVLVGAGRWASRGEDILFPELGGVARGRDGDETTRMSARARWGELSVQGRLWERVKDIPTASWGGDFNHPEARTRDVWGFLDARWSTRLGTGRRLQLRGAYDGYHYAGFYPSGGVMYADKNDVRRWLLAGDMTWELRADNRLVIGGEARHHPRADYRAWEDEDKTFDHDFPYSTWSVFVQDEHHITSELVFLAGLRYDWSQLGFDRATPRGALVWTPAPGSTWKLLYGEAFRAPSLYEVHFEENEFLRSEGLEPEVARTAEIVWERRIAPLVWSSVSVFDTDVRRLIDTVIDGEFARFENREGMKARGGELEVQTRGGRGMARGSYAYARAEVTGGGEASNVPSHVVRAAVAGPLFGPLAGGVQARRESGRLTLYETRTDAALLVDAHVSLSEHRGGLRASMGVRNALNAAFSVPGGFEHVQATIPQARRSVQVSLEYRF